MILGESGFSQAESHSLRENILYVFSKEFTENSICVQVELDVEVKEKLIGIVISKKGGEKTMTSEIKVGGGRVCRLLGEDGTCRSRSVGGKRPILDRGGRCRADTTQDASDCMYLQGQRAGGATRFPSPWEGAIKPQGK